MPELGRRRQYEEDTDGDRGFEPRYANKRARVEAIKYQTPYEQLEDKVIKFLQQNGHVIIEQIETFTAELPRDEGDSQLDDLVAILIKCLMYLPTLTCNLTTVIGYLNNVKHRTVQQLVRKLHGEISERLKVGEFDYALTAISSLADLRNANVVSSSSLMAFLNQLVDEAEQQNVPQARNDWFIFAALRALVYCGRSLNRHHPNETKQLLLRCNNIVNRRDLTHVQALQVWHGTDGDVPPQEDYLVSFTKQINNLYENGFSEFVLQRPYIHPNLVKIFKDCFQHNLPEMFKAPTHHEYAKYPQPTVTFLLFNDEDVDNDVILGQLKSDQEKQRYRYLPKPTTIERFLVAEDIRWTLRQMYTNRRMVCDALINHSLALYIPYTYILVETIFGELLKQPNSALTPIAYASILAELEKSQLLEFYKIMPQPMRKASELFFKRLPSMSIQCVDRVSEWLAFHLSQHQYKYEWDEWECALEQTGDTIQRYYVRETFQQMLRLSYYMQLKSVVSTQFASLMPPEPIIDNKYEKEGTSKLPGHETCVVMQNMIVDKKSAEEIRQFMRHYIEEEAQDTITHENGQWAPSAVDIFTSVALFMSSRSPDYTLVAMVKYRAVFQDIIPKGCGDAQMKLLSVIYELWGANELRLLFIIDKFIKMSVLECVQIVQWTFTAMKDHLLKQWVWQLMANVMSKHSRMLAILAKDVTDCQFKHNEAQNRVDLLQQEDQGMGGNEMHDDNDAEEGLKDEPLQARVQSAQQSLEETAKKLETTNTQIELYKQQQKELLLTFFQHIFIILTEYLFEKEAEGVDIDSFWYYCMSQRLRHMLLFLHNEVHAESLELEETLFGEEAPQPLVAIFKQVKALSM